MNNPDDNSGKLTVEELRAFPGCEHYNDAEAQAIIDGLHAIAVFLFNTTIVDNSIPGENNFESKTDEI